MKDDYNEELVSRHELPNLNFDEEPVSNPHQHQLSPDPDFNEDDDDDDVPLITQGTNDEYEDDFINLSLDMDEYKAPIENLQVDYLTQHVVEEDFSDEHEEDDDETTDNINQVIEDTDSRDSEVIGPSPVKKPTNRLGKPSIKKE